MQHQWYKRQDRARDLLAGQQTLHTGRVEEGLEDDVNTMMLVDM